MSKIYCLGVVLSMTPACSLCTSCSRGTVASEATPTWAIGTENPLAKMEYNSWVGLSGSMDWRVAWTSPRDTSLQQRFRGGDCDSVTRTSVHKSYSSCNIHGGREGHFVVHQSSQRIRISHYSFPCRRLRTMHCSSCRRGYRCHRIFCTPENYVPPYKIS